MTRLVGTVLLLLAVPSSVSAHTKSTSYSTWQILERGADVTVQVALYDLTSVQGDAVEHVLSHLTATSQGKPCTVEPDSVRSLPAKEGWTRWFWRLQCSAQPDQFTSTLFGALPSHLHLMSIGDATRPAVLTRSDPTLVVDQSGASRSAGLMDFLKSGVKHILSGWDHLAFVVLLLFCAARPKDVFILVSGFTLGHSISLALAALNIVEVDVRAVESIIALSIVAIAIENVWSEFDFAPRWLWLVVLVTTLVVAWVSKTPALRGIALFMGCYLSLLARHPTSIGARGVFAALFGLFHGFGFAGVLVGADRAVSLSGLLSFNVGVEIGQLAVVAVAWPVLSWLSRQSLRRETLVWTCAVGAGVGGWAAVQTLSS